jgi:hypothetical protein
MFVAFLGTKSGDTSREVALEGSTREVEECGLDGMMQGATGSLKLLLGARFHPRKAGIVDFTFGPQAYPNIWGARLKWMRWASGTLKISSYRKRGNLCLQDDTENRGVRQYPLPSVVQTAVHELYTLSAVVSFAHKPDTCPTT